jgi:hypothetical protein
MGRVRVSGPCSKSCGRLSKVHTHYSENMIVQVRSRASGWFALAEDIAQFCSDLLPHIRPESDDGQKVLSAILFRRILSSFEAVVLMAERGMHTEGMVLRRLMLEGLFVLGAIWQQPELVRTYVQNDQHRRRDIYKNLRKTSHESRRRLSAWITDEELDEKINELEQATKGVRYLSVEQFSQCAKLHDLYLTDYSLLSEPAHHLARDLERQITIGNDDGIKSVIWGPESETPFDLLFPATDQMLMAAHVMSKMFRLDIKENFDQFSTRSQQLSEQEVER